ncbi:MAG: putative redox protein [Psychroserpens sp.]|jgi:putative redox protein
MGYKVNTVWKEKMTFESQLGNHTVRMDTTPELGDDSGASPKQLLLAGLAGCTGMDVVSLLNKMRVSFTNFEMEIEADLTEEHPVVFSEIRLIWIQPRLKNQLSSLKINTAV